MHGIVKIIRNVLISISGKEDATHMTSRERVVRALSHEKTDRIPIDLGGSIVTGINSMAYQNVKRYLGLSDTRSRVTNIILMLSEVEGEFIGRWKIDVLPLDRYEAAPGVPLSGKWIEHPLPDGQPAWFPEGFKPEIREDGTWALRREGIVTDILSPGSGSFVPAHHPLKDATVKDLDSFEIPVISDEELEYLHRRAKYLYEETDYAIFGWFNGSIFETSQFLCGWDGFMLRLAAEKDFASKLLGKLTDAVIRDLKLYLDAVGEYIQVIGFGDDFGIQDGLQISKEMFREMIKPHLKRIYGFAKKSTDAFLFLHSCGSVSELIEDFIEMGIDVLNPVQTSAQNMSLPYLKEKFGERISFWGGGCDVQKILPMGSEEEIRRDVRERLELFRDSGGFVFAPIHNIQADVPPKNIVAMYDEAAGQ